MPAAVPPIELPARPAGRIDRAIADHVAQLVPDRATIELGLGAMSALAVLRGGYEGARLLGFPSPLEGEGTVSRCAGDNGTAAGHVEFARDSPLEEGVSCELVSEVGVFRCRPGITQIPRPLWMIIEAEKGYFGLESGKFAVFCPSELPPLMDRKLLMRLLFSRSVV